MQQYLDLLKAIQEKGTYKPAAREGMPGTQSLFGYQFRYNLQDGFPLLTTKRMFWKGVVIELLWFLRGDTNIKYLVDNGVRIWDEDAYNYYVKLCKEAGEDPCGFDGFKASIEVGDLTGWRNMPEGYRLGDCGFQYGKVWRHWGWYVSKPDESGNAFSSPGIDQIANIIAQLKKSPESRRHLVTAIDPSHDTELALYWCHAMFQFNCRPIEYVERMELALQIGFFSHEEEPVKEGTYGKRSMILNMAYISKFIPELANDQHKRLEEHSEISCEEIMDICNVPKYHLDCQLYQRSADVFLGVPFNIASYALLTHVIAKMVNMVPGEFIHTFGDVHIYDNHKEAVAEQLTRTPGKLPYLNTTIEPDMEDVFEWKVGDFELRGYDPQPAIKAELSTGLKK